MTGSVSTGLYELQRQSAHARCVTSAQVFGELGQRQEDDLSYHSLPSAPRCSGCVVLGHRQTAVCVRRCSAGAPAPRGGQPAALGGGRLARVRPPRRAAARQRGAAPGARGRLARRPPRAPGALGGRPRRCAARPPPRPPPAPAPARACLLRAHACARLAAARRSWRPWQAGQLPSPAVASKPPRTRSRPVYTKSPYLD